MIDCIAENIHLVITPKYRPADDNPIMVTNRIHIRNQEYQYGGRVCDLYSRYQPNLKSCGYRVAPNVICEGVYD